jgi:tripartite ATP-independent transporter DctM subunit
MFMGAPIGVVMGLVGVGGMIWVSGLSAGLGILKTVPLATISTYDYSVIPLFILMGELCFHSGLSKSLYWTVHKWIGNLPGGLSMATVGGCAAFAAVSGSSLATAATMGTVALPEMERYHYDPALATGSVAAGGTIGILIPPSVIMIIYGILTQQSIGKLFLAGFIPGVLEAVFYIATIYILCKRNPLLGPRGPKTSFKEKVIALKDTWGVAALFVLIIGGIYLGIFTPIEAGGVGAFGAFVFALSRRRLSWENFVVSLIETCKSTAMITFIIIGAMMFSYFLAVTRLPFELANIIAALPLNRYALLTIILMAYLLIGCVMDAMAMILLTVPIFFPLAMSLGFDPIWFGIIIVRVFEMAAITPPVGMNVYVIHGVAKNVPMYTIFRGIFPFLIADIFHVALLVLVPQVALFLPSLMK